MIADFHATAINQVPEARLVSVYSRREEQSREFAAKYGIRTASSLEELAHDPGVQAVCITTPSGAHLEPALAAIAAGKHVVVEKPLEVTVPRTGAAAGSVACDEVLFEKLRRLRKRLADEQGVPPYIVFGDVSLRHMARDCPTTEREFLSVPGVGETKLRVYGDEFLEEIAAHVAANGRRAGG